jgi:hypothetical protein
LFPHSVEQKNFPAFCIHFCLCRLWAMKCWVCFAKSAIRCYSNQLARVSPPYCLVLSSDREREGGTLISKTLMCRIDFFSLLSLFWKNERRLMRSPCCMWARLCLSICLCISPNCLGLWGLWDHLAVCLCIPLNFY